MNRFPEMGNFAHPYRVWESPILASMYKSFLILTDIVKGAMLAIEAAMLLPFVDTAVRKQLDPNLWKVVEKDEKIFTRILTRGEIYGMISGGMTLLNCCGDADAAAEAPPRLTSSPNLARSYVVRW